MAAISFLAHIIWVATAVFLCSTVLRRADTYLLHEGRHARRLVAAGFLLVVIAFSFLPPGSLPPWRDTAWSGSAFMGALTALCLLARRWDAVPACVVFVLVFGVFARYAAYRGMPGSPANLGTFVAMPVWGIAVPRDVFGFLALVPAFAVAARTILPPANEALSPLDSLALLAVAALYVTLFLPFVIAPFASCPAAIIAGGDYALFWAKTLLVCYAVPRLPVPSVRAKFACALCGLAGAAIILGGTV